MNDIYATPTADLSAPTHGLREFPRFSAWWVFLLSVITLYLYTVYWLYSRSLIVNRLFPRDAISPVFVFGLPIAHVGSIVVSIASAILVINIGDGYWSSPSTEVWINVADVAIAIGTIFWAFAIRRRLNMLLQREARGIVDASPVLTFFFGAIYLAYKINQGIDAAARDA
jgi:hypothetical protein